MAVAAKTAISRKAIEEVKKEGMVGEEVEVTTA